MKASAALAAVLLLGALRPDPAHAWASANRWGGSTTHSWGTTTHDNAWGGSSTHNYGEGTEHTNPYGGHSYGKEGYGWEHTTASGASAYHPPTYYGGYHPPSYYGGYHGYAYHPPVAVPYYSGSGCTGCAAAAGAVVGVAAGVAIGAAAARPPAYAPPPPVVYATLPAGCVYRILPHEYECGGAWFAPSYGANGVYYQMVPPP